MILRDASRLQFFSPYPRTLTTMFRSIADLKPWDIYARELGDLGFGHPLWVPEPLPEHGEIRLGDVGYLSQGRFCFLFNCMHDANDPINRNGVPDGFEVFVPPDGPAEESAITISNLIMDRMLLSRNVRSIDVGVNSSLRYVMPLLRS